MTENMTAYQAGLEIPKIVTKPFLDVFVNVGGGGFTIGLIVVSVLLYMPFVIAANKLEEV